MTDARMPDDWAPYEAASLAREDLVHELDQLVRRVDGVTDLYDARPSALAAVTTAAARLTGHTPAEPVVVAASKTGLTVSVSLAVSESHPAADTCRRVFDVVNAFVTTNAPGDTLRAVRIRVSRIG
jgi:hypothetical protein